MAGADTRRRGVPVHAFATLDRRSRSPKPHPSRLQTNTALVHHIRVDDAIVFEEREDEGPIVFALTDAGVTPVFTGQDLSRHLARGIPWRELDIRETPRSHRFLGLERLGARHPL